MKTANESGSRVFFTEGDQALPIPDLIAHQKDSWEDFVKSGLREVFNELNPIDDYTGQKLSLRFKDYYFKEVFSMNNQSHNNCIFATLITSWKGSKYSSQPVKHLNNPVFS